MPERRKDREPLRTDSCEVAVFASFGNTNVMKIEIAVRLNSGSGKGEIKGDECAPCQHTDGIQVIYVEAWLENSMDGREWQRAPEAGDKYQK